MLTITSLSCNIGWTPANKIIIPLAKSPGKAILGHMSQFTANIHRCPTLNVPYHYYIGRKEQRYRRHSDSL